ncbi:MAG: hypothetical protein GY950_01285 [bacterium]|nr:hypothetical protein [bacterium]
MSKKVEITVENKLLKEKRDINIYHHSSGSAHLLSHNSTEKLSLYSAAEGDYLHISVVSGPGCLKTGCVISVPSWADVELTAERKITLTHSGSRILLKLPPGPPLWQLKITRPSDSSITPSCDTITIGDEESDREN